MELMQIVNSQKIKKDSAKAIEWLFQEAKSIMQLKLGSLESVKLNEYAALPFSCAISTKF